MKNCSKQEYKSDPRPDKCDYQEAQCLYVTDDHNGTRVDCEVRRKGSATWRDLDNRPSIKVKKMEDDGDAYRFDDDWESEKVTLNNGVQKIIADAEVKAYDVFRQLGVVSPLAKLCSVALYRDEVLSAGPYEDYTMIETIDDKAFMRKHFGEDWVLWEVEYDEQECERDNGVFNKACDEETENVMNLTMKDVDEEEMINYYVGETTTIHWDGACHNPRFLNNHYVAKWMRDGEQRYTFIPSGVDQTFQCWNWAFTKNAFNLDCSTMMECLSNDECHTKTKLALRKARDVFNVDKYCSNDWTTVSAAGAALSVAAIPLIGFI